MKELSLLSNHSEGIFFCGSMYYIRGRSRGTKESWTKINSNLFEIYLALGIHMGVAHHVGE